MPDASDPVPLPSRRECAAAYGNGRKVVAESTKTAAQRRFRRSRPTSLLSPKPRLLNEVACTMADGRIIMFTWLQSSVDECSGRVLENDEMTFL